MTEHFDVIVVGAGLSGIGAGYHLQTRCPDRSYAILEGRDAIGGTWDLFRYPGIRSDSDMHTLGYNFRPWTREKAIADGPSIREYVTDTARTYGIDRHIHFGHRVVAAGWSTPDACWTVECRLGDGSTRRFTCNFLYMCSGYYNYATGHAPEFPGAGDFRGRIVHPQFWPEDLDYAGKKVVVIGSGATAVTLVPEPGESGGACHYAPALPHLRRLAPGGGSFRQHVASRVAGKGRLWLHALEERAAPDVFLSRGAQASGAGEGAAGRDGARAAR